NRSSNQLVSYRLPPNTGFTGIQMNLVANIENTGFEAEASAQLVDRGNLSWSAGANISVPRNKLRSFPGLEGSAYASTYVIGQPLQVSNRYRYLGVDAQTVLDRFEDFNADGVINTADRQVIRTLQPRLQAGLHQSLVYGKFSLDLFVQAVE